MIQATKPVEQVVEAIRQLDLDPIKLKLMDAEEGQGWSREYCDRMELAYRRFLTLLVRFPEETIAPTRDVDKFWHGHILDTMKYAEDCARVFGYFLHHFPYFGMRGEQDAADLRAASERMHALYAREFGGELSKASAFCYAAEPAQKEASAFCYAAEPAQKEASAFCYAAEPVQKEASAFCYAAKPVQKEASAFCYAAKPARQEATAFCYAAKPAHREASAFCYAARPAQGATGAFCYAAGPTQAGTTTLDRPKLVPST